MGEGDVGTGLETFSQPALQLLPEGAFRPADSYLWVPRAHPEMIAFTCPTLKSRPAGVSPVMDAGDLPG
jgi:hypothetical protein